MCEIKPKFSWDKGNKGDKENGIKQTDQWH